MDLQAYAEDRLFIVNGADLEYTKTNFKNFTVNDSVLEYIYILKRT